MSTINFLRLLPLVDGNSTSDHAFLALEKRDTSVKCLVVFVDYDACVICVPILRTNLHERDVGFEQSLHTTAKGQIDGKEKCVPRRRRLLCLQKKKKEKFERKSAGRVGRACCMSTRRVQAGMRVSPQMHKHSSIESIG